MHLLHVLLTDQSVQKSGHPSACLLLWTGFIEIEPSSDQPGWLAEAHKLLLFLLLLVSVVLLLTTKGASQAIVPGSSLLCSADTCVMTSLLHHPLGRCNGL